MLFIFVAIEQSLLMLPLVCGMYLSYRILKVTDLTVDGTYVLGAIIFAHCIDYGVMWALTLSILSGAIVGVIVALMQRHNRVSDLVVGILASFMLYSVNLNIAGKPNISLVDKGISYTNWVPILAIISIIIILLLIVLLRSKMGLLLRAFGYNRKLLHTLGKSVESYRILGLVCSNTLASLSGALTAQVNGFADINMGFGVALVGIGAVVIGQHLRKNEDAFIPTRDLLLCFAGISLYFLSLNLLLLIGINPINLKLLLGLFLFLTLRSANTKRGEQ